VLSKQHAGRLLQVLNSLLQLRRALGNIGNSRADFIDLLGWRTVGKLRVGQLGNQLR